MENKKRKLYLQRWYQKNRKEILKYAKEYNKINRENRLLKQKERYKKVREETIKRYGGKCACCGETEIKFLTIDHIKNDGTKHRKQMRGTKIVFWLKYNNYPKGYQILCYNCNMAKGFYGKCPHQK